MKLGFRPLTAGDLPLLYEWVQREHVQRWWTDRETYDEVVEHYLPAIEGKGADRSRSDPLGRPTRGIHPDVPRL